jgi:hypothetical protein
MNQNQNGNANDIAGKRQHEEAMLTQRQTRRDLIQKSKGDPDTAITMIADIPPSDTRLFWAVRYCEYLKCTGTGCSETTALRLLALMIDKRRTARLLLYMYMVADYRVDRFNWSNIYILFGEEYVWLYAGVKRHIDRIMQERSYYRDKYRGLSPWHSLNIGMTGWYDDMECIVSNICNAEEQRKSSPHAPVYYKDRDARILEQSTMWVDENTGELLPEMPLPIKERITSQMPAILEHERQMGWADRVCKSFIKYQRTEKDDGDASDSISEEDHYTPQLPSTPNRMYRHVLSVGIAVILYFVLITEFKNSS